MPYFPDALQEAEESKRRCDWAFTERDKIVRERESIRTLCDKLRHERDTAVSKHIEALRDMDELKKHKSEAQKELKDVRLVFCVLQCILYFKITNGILKISCFIWQVVLK